MPAEKKQPSSSQNLGWLLNVLHFEVAEALDHGLKQHGLSLSLWPTLSALWDEDNLTQTELSLRSRSPAYATSRALDKLTTLGLVERLPDPASRRSHRVHLTAAGAALQDELTDLASGASQQLLDRLPEAERPQLLRLLYALVGLPNTDIALPPSHPADWLKTLS